MFLSVCQYSKWLRRERNGAYMHTKIKDKKSDSGYIYRTHITINGVTYYAKNYGKRAFKIPVSELR